MSLHATCSNCHRELLLEQLLGPGEGYRCPFCGQAFAPSYATVAPGLTAQVIAAHAALVKALGELAPMLGGRLVIEPAPLLDPITASLPAARQPA